MSDDTSDELQLGARGAGKLVVHDVLEHCPGGVVVTERVQPVAVRIAQTVFEEQEYGQRDEQHGQCRIVGHNNTSGAFYTVPGRVRCTRVCVIFYCVRTTCAPHWSDADRSNRFRESVYRRSTPYNDIVGSCLYDARVYIECARVCLDVYSDSKLAAAKRILSPVPTDWPTDRPTARTTILLLLYSVHYTSLLLLLLWLTGYAVIYARSPPCPLKKHAK